MSPYGLANGSSCGTRSSFLLRTLVVVATMGRQISVNATQAYDAAVDRAWGAALTLIVLVFGPTDWPAAGPPFDRP